MLRNNLKALQYKGFLLFEKMELMPD